MSNIKNYFWQPLDADKKKYRTSFSRTQLEKLETCFENTKYLTVRDRVVLSKNLKLTDSQIKTWYQNRRLVIVIYVVQFVIQFSIFFSFKFANSTKWKKGINKYHSKTNKNDTRYIEEMQKSNEYNNRLSHRHKGQQHDSNVQSGNIKDIESLNEEIESEKSLFEFEEKYFESITDPYLYSLVKRWYFNVFMHAYSTPHVQL